MPALNSTLFSPWIVQTGNGMTKILLTLALLVAVPAAAQVPFGDLPDQATLDPTQQILVYDGTITDPLQRQRRMMLRRALDWVLANPTATATETLATIGIGGTVYNFADTDTHVEIRAGSVIRTNPAFVNFTGNRVLVSTTGTDGALVNIIGPLIYSEGTLVFADPTVLDFTGAGVTTTADPVSGLVTIGIPGGGSGMADGVATAGAYDSTRRRDRLHGGNAGVRLLRRRVRACRRWRRQRGHHGHHDRGHLRASGRLYEWKLHADVLSRCAASIRHERGAGAVG